MIGSSTSISLDSSLVSPTDSLECIITATDGQGDTAISSATVAVDNSVPMVSNVLINPQANARTNSTLTCSAVLTDSDNEGLSLDMNGLYPEFPLEVVIPSHWTHLWFSLDNRYPVKPLQWMAMVPRLESASITVGGFAPVISSISIAPDPAYNDSGLTCSVVATDADNQSLTESYTWTNLNTGGTIGSSATLSLSSLNSSPNDVLLCEVTVSDTSGETASTSSQILENRAPDTPVVSLSPDPATYEFNTNLFCKCIRTGF